MLDLLPALGHVARLNIRFQYDHTFADIPLLGCEHTVHTLRLRNKELPAADTRRGPHYDPNHAAWGPDITL